MVVTLWDRKFILLSLLSFKLPKLGPFMVQTWSSHGPPYCVLLNLNDCMQGYFMPNFSVLSLMTDISNFLPEGGIQGVI